MNSQLLQINGELSTLKQFNEAARNELRQVRKKLRKLHASSEKKERHKLEILRRRKETMEKLRLSNLEHETLLAQIAGLRKELRNEKHASMVEACQIMIRPYVEEIEREVEQGVGVGAVSSKSRNLRQLRLTDESDSQFVEEERKMMLGRLTDEQDTAQVADFDPYDRGAGRHTLEAHKSGVADKSETASSNPNNTVHGNPQGNGDEATPSGQNAGIARGGDEEEKGADDGDDGDFDREMGAAKRWVKFRQKQLMRIRNDDEDVMLNAKNERAALMQMGNEKTKSGDGSRGQFAVDVVYKESQGFEYTCQLAVVRGYTFEDLVAEACAHWGLAPEYTFLEDPETQAIWPSSAVVEVELPLHTATPRLNLVFREHMDIASLVMQVESKALGGIGLDSGDPEFGGISSKYDPNSGALEGSQGRKTAADDVHNVSSFHPHRIKMEMKRRARARDKLEKAKIDPKLFKLRKSFLARDFFTFCLFFVLLNMSVLGKRNIVNQFWLMQAFDTPLVEREFVGTQDDFVPKLNRQGGIPVLNNVSSEEGASTSSHDFYRWWQQLSYRDIKDAQQWWLWVQSPLQDLLYGAANGTNHTQGYLREGSTQLLGKLRFRQLRVKPNRGCVISYLAQSYFSECYAEFTDQRQDTAQFTTAENTNGFSWSSGGGLNGQSTRISGTYATYPGDGYIVDLPFGTREEFQYEIDRLRSNNWLDLQTRAVFVEFTAYNAAFGNYISNHYLVEQTSSGLWSASTHTYIGSMNVCLFCDSLYLVLDVVLYVVILWIIYTEMLLLMHACRDRGGIRTYCCETVWSLHYCITIVCFLFSLLTRAFTISGNLTTLENLWRAADAQNPNYYDITESLRVTDTADFVDAFTTLFLALRIFRYLQYHSRMQQFTKVFVLAGMEIIFFAFMFAFTFFGFVLLGHNIYGAFLSEWSTIIGTFRTLVKMMVGNFDYEAMRQVDMIWTPVYFFCYIIFVFMILVNVFLAILNTSYSSVREARTLEKTRYEKMKAQKPVHAENKNSQQSPNPGSNGLFTRAKNAIYHVFGLSEDDPIFSRDMFLVKGVYVPIEQVERELRVDRIRKSAASNPWVAS